MTPIPYPTSMSTPLLQVCGILIASAVCAGLYVLMNFVNEWVSRNNITDKNGF